MPEGPEVEAARSSVEKHCLGSTVVKFVLEEQGGGMREGMVDEKVCLATRDELTATALSHSLDNVSRKGKHFWMQFSSGYSLLFHLGMTGSVAFKGRKVAAYKSFTVSSTWPPKFTKLMLEFSNGERFAFCDPRRLGRIRVLKDPLCSPPVSLLAPDPLLEPLSVDKVSVILSKSTAPIKSALLDQEKVCCGIGNWVADEVLYQGSIHPQTPCNVVASCECSVNNLVRTIDKVLNEAVMANADDKAFPSDWLFHKRWGKGKRKEIPTMPNGKTLRSIALDE
jgi:formamidopyrimidine-DNA glycosylase